jgi:hypothetical protein
MMRMNGQGLEIISFGKVKINDRVIEFKDGFVKLKPLD